MANTQFLVAQRPLTIKLDGKGPYIATKLHGNETLSGGCTLTIAIASDTMLQEKILGKVACATFEQQGKKRTFQGLVVSIELIEFSQEKGLYFYQVETQDPLAILAFRHNRQIFQKMSSKQIIEKVLGETEFKSYFKFSVSGNGRQHEYCTQMDETDLHFIQRLLSSEGWHYRLDHTGSKPMVIIADSNQSFTSAKKSTLYFKDGSQDTESVVTQWAQLYRLGSNKLSLAEHSQELAQVLESGERKSMQANGPSSLQQYLFGQGVEDKSALRDLAKSQMEAFDAQKTASRSASTLAELACGMKFKLAKHPVAESNQEYVVTQITHWIESGESGRQTHYQNQFTCLPTAVTFRPSRIAKPVVQCIHSASVTGPKGEEIYKDKLGRIKVQFHWDQNGKNDENSSCWLPVSQGMASKGFGIQFIPRIGDEVLVQYIDGNPDRPVVVGSIYNKSNQAPYSAATQSGIKTRTTPKGSSQQGNELRFEDQKDKEQVFLHAEKDLLLEVNNDQTTTIKGKMLSSAEKGVELSTKENFIINSEKDLQTSSKGKFSASADKDITLKSSANVNLDASSTVKVDGQSIAINGKSKIELSVGASKIEISASGIKLDAPQISINGKAKAEMKAAMVSIEGQGKTDIKGALVTVEGSAMTQVKAGAMVQIQGAIAKVN
ncbi:TPA: type VI secretion system tip protein VgrG [Vibrio vulnificus]|nr:type VI secretion system tip protein VgrG [Vibrio vulnificus]